MHIWGEGDEVWHWTTEHDCAEFTAAITEKDDAEDQQFWSVCSGVNTLTEMAETYGRVRGSGGVVVKKGNLEDLRREAYAARAKGSVKNFWEYIGKCCLPASFQRMLCKPFKWKYHANPLPGWFYQLFTVDGTWLLEDLDNEKLSVIPSSLEQFVKDDPAI